MFVVFGVSAKELRLLMIGCCSLPPILVTPTILELQFLQALGA